MKKVIIFLYLFSLEINPQSFRLGFDFEAQQVRVNHQILGGEGFPLAYHLNFAYSPIEKFLLIANVGRTLHINFAGWEFGAAARYKFYDPFFASAGILQHSNSGGGGSNSWGTNYASLLLLFAAAGVETSSITSIQLGYYHPTSIEAIGYNWLDNHTRLNLLKFTSMIRLSFIFSWEI